MRSFAMRVLMGTTLRFAPPFANRIAKGRVTRLSLLRSGVQVMIVGAVSAGVGFAIGHLVTTLYG